MFLLPVHLTAQELERLTHWWWLISKTHNHTRDPLIVPVRQLRRITVTLDTLLRLKLGFEPKPLGNPRPVEPEACIEYLRKVVEESERAKPRK